VHNGTVPQEEILEGIHASIVEHQSGIVFDHHWRRRHDLVPFGGKKLEEMLSNQLGFHGAVRGLFPRISDLFTTKICKTGFRTALSYEYKLHLCLLMAKRFHKIRYNEQTLRMEEIPFAPRDYVLSSFAKVAIFLAICWAAFMFLTRISKAPRTAHSGVNWHSWKSNWIACKENLMICRWFGGHFRSGRCHLPVHFWR